MRACVVCVACVFVRVIEGERILVARTHCAVYTSTTKKLETPHGQASPPHTHTHTHEHVHTTDEEREGETYERDNWMKDDFVRQTSFPVLRYYSVFYLRVFVAPLWSPGIRLALCFVFLLFFPPKLCLLYMAAVVCKKSVEILCYHLVCTMYGYDVFMK